MFESLFCYRGWPIPRIEERNLEKKAVDKKFTIGVMAERCPQNHACPIVRRCPESAVMQDGFKAPTIDQDKCVKCMVYSKMDEKR